MTASPPPHDPRRLAAEMFLTAAGPALVKRVVEILRPAGIPVMPLKGVLLQRWVYRGAAFRPIADVDLLVPENRFGEAFQMLRGAAFSKVRWEDGGWEVTLRDPAGPPLAVDLHRRLSRTVRSRLTSAGLFSRGSADSELFGVPVMLPSPHDLFSHLLLHAALHWTSTGTLHRPDDFGAMAQSALLDDVDSCAEHLRRQGLAIHGLALLPKIIAQAPSDRVAQVLANLEGQATPKQRMVAGLVDWLRRAARSHPQARRVAGLLLAPSLPGALASAARDRLTAHPERSMELGHPLRSI